MPRRWLTLLYAAWAMGGLAGQPPAGAPKGRLAWKSLFDGTSLKGWTMDGRGRWAVEDGCIVGRQDPATHSETWLLSEAELGDFVLVAKFQITEGGNSGIFLRAPDVRGHPGRLGCKTGWLPFK